MQTKITKRRIDDAKGKAAFDGVRIYMRDTDITGFVCLVTPKGNVSYLVEYRQGGKQHRVKIGQHNPMTPYKARKEARQVLARAHAGEDVKRPVVQVLTFGEALEKYLANAGAGNRTWKSTKQILKYDALPAWRSTPVTDIKRHHVAELIDRVQKRTPSGARLLFAQLRPMFRWFVERSLIEFNPTSELKAPAPPKSRDRVLDDAELAQVWEAADLDWFPFGPIIRMLILTGARVSEVAGITMDELQDDQWVISGDRTKNAVEHTVHLCPLALETLHSIPAVSHIIFSTTGRTPPSGFSKAKMRMDKALPDLPPWRFHDLRRSFASGMAALGVDPHIVERCINHVSGSQSGIQGIYQRYKYMSERKQAFMLWDRHITELVKQT